MPADDLKLEPDYREAHAAYAADPNPRTTGALLRAVDPIINLGISTYGDKSAISRGVARRIAVDAFRTYDPAKAAMKTHLMSRLQGLRRTMGAMDAGVRTPELARIQQQRVAEATDSLTAELGRPPSDAEIMDHVGLSAKRLAKIRGYKWATPAGSFAAMTTGDGDVGVDPAVDMGDPTLRDAEFIYDDLDAVDQYILERSLGMRGHARTPANEIAKALRISPSAVSQRAVKIQARLDEMYDKPIFG